MDTLVMYSANTWALAQEIVDAEQENIFHEVTPTTRSGLEGFFCINISQGSLPSYTNWSVMGNYVNGVFVAASPLMESHYNRIYPRTPVQRQAYGIEMTITPPVCIGKFLV